MNQIRLRKRMKGLTAFPASRCAGSYSGEGSGREGLRLNARRAARVPPHPQARTFACGLFSFASPDVSQTESSTRSNFPHPRRAFPYFYVAYDDDLPTVRRR